MSNTYHYIAELKVLVLTLVQSNKDDEKDLRELNWKQRLNDLTKDPATEKTDKGRKY